jgi:hypothetical protein
MRFTMLSFPRESLTYTVEQYFCVAFLNDKHRLFESLLLRDHKDTLLMFRCVAEGSSPILQSCERSPIFGNIIIPANFNWERDTTFTIFSFHCLPQILESDG